MHNFALSLTVMGSLKTFLLFVLPLWLGALLSHLRPRALAHPLSLAPGLRPPAGGGALNWVTSTFSTIASPGRRGGSGGPGASELSSPGILGLARKKQSQREAEMGRPCGSLLGASSPSSLQALL